MANGFEIIQHGESLVTRAIRSAANTTGVVVKATPGRLYGGLITNYAASGRFIKIYDKATAPTSSDIPLFTMFAGATGTTPIVSTPLVYGIPFSNGISYRITTGQAESDNTAPAAGDVNGYLVFT